MKLRFFVLWTVLLCCKTPILFCQEQEAHNFKEEVISNHAYSAFLNQVAEHQQVVYPSLLRLGKPGSYRYQVLPTENPDAPMCFLSWNDAAEYCEWKNSFFTTPTFSLKSSAVEAAQVDRELKSNMLTFCLVNTTVQDRQAEGEEMIEETEADECLEAILGEICIAAGLGTLNRPEESTREQQVERIDSPILKNETAERDGELLQGRAFLFLEIPRRESDNHPPINIEESSPEDHVRWDTKEEANRLSACIGQLEEEYEYNPDKKIASTIENKKKELANVKALWEVMADTAEKNSNTLKKSKRSAEESRNLWEKRDQEAIGLRREYNASKQEETQRLDLLEKANSSWKEEKYQLGMDVLLHQTSDKNDRGSNESDNFELHSESQDSLKISYISDQVLREWFEMAKTANTIPKGQNPETYRAQWKKNDEGLIKKRTLFNNAKKEAKTEAIKEQKWQDDIIRWNLINKIKELTAEKKEKDNLIIRLKQKAEAGTNSPSKPLNNIRTADNEKSGIKNKIQEAKNKWTQLTLQTEDLKEMLTDSAYLTNKEAENLLKEAEKILFNRDKATNKAREILLRKLQNQNTSSPTSNLNTPHSSSGSSSAKLESPFVLLEQKLKDDDFLKDEQAEAALNEYPKQAKSEALYDIRKERPADLALAAWEEKKNQSQERADKAQFLAELSGRFIGIFEKEKSHIESIQKHINQEIEKKISKGTAYTTEAVQNFSQEIFSTVIEALGLPTNLIKTASPLIAKGIKKGVSKIAQILTNHINASLSSNFDIEALANDRQKIAERCLFIAKANADAYAAAKKEDERLKHFEGEFEKRFHEDEDRNRCEVEEAATKYILGNKFLWISLTEAQRDSYNRAAEVANADYDNLIEQESANAQEAVHLAQKAHKSFKRSPGKQFANIFTGNKKLLKKELNDAKNSLAVIEQREAFLTWGKKTPVQRATQLSLESTQKTTDPGTAPNLIPHFEEQAKSWSAVASYLNKAKSSPSEEACMEWLHLANQSHLAAEHQQNLIDAITNHKSTRELEIKYKDIKSEIEKHDKIAQLLEDAAKSTSKYNSALLKKAAEALLSNDPNLAEIYIKTAEALQLDDLKNGLKLAKIYIKAVEAIAQQNGLSVFYLKAAEAFKINNQKLFELWLNTASSAGKEQELWNKSATAFEEDKKEISSYFGNAAQAIADGLETLSSLWEEAALETKERPRQLLEKAATALQNKNANNEKISELYQNSVKALYDKKNTLSTFYENAASALEAKNEKLSALWENTAKAFRDSNYNLSDPSFKRWHAAAEALLTGNEPLADLLGNVARTNNEELRQLWKESAIALELGNNELSRLFQNAAREENQTLRQRRYESAMALKNNNIPLFTLFKNAVEADDDEIRRLWNESANALKQRKNELSALFQFAATAESEEQRQLWNEAATAFKNDHISLSTLFKNAAEADDDETRQLWIESAIALKQRKNELSALFKNAATANNEELRQLLSEAATAFKNNNTPLFELFDRAAKAKANNNEELSSLLKHAADYLKKENEGASDYFLKAANAHELGRTEIAQLWKKTAMAHLKNKSNLKILWKKAAQAFKQEDRQLWINSATALENNDPALSKLWQHAALAKEQNSDFFELWQKAALASQNNDPALSELWEKAALAKEKKYDSFELWEKAALALQNNEINLSQLWKNAAEASKQKDRQPWINGATALQNNQPRIASLWQNIALAKGKNDKSYYCWQCALDALLSHKEEKISNYWERAAIESETNNQEYSEFWQEAAHASESLNAYKVEAYKKIDFYNYEVLNQNINFIENSILNFVKILDSSAGLQEKRKALSELKQDIKMLQEERVSCTIQ